MIILKAGHIPTGNRKVTNFTPEQFEKIPGILRQTINLFFSSTYRRNIFLSFLQLL